MVPEAFLRAACANPLFLALTRPSFCCVLPPGHACADPAPTVFGHLVPLVPAVLDHQFFSVAAWWQTIKAELAVFPNGPLLAAVTSRAVNQPLLFGAIAVAICSFLALLGLWLRRRRLRAAVAPAHAGDLAGVYRRYERSDSVPRRDRRGAKAGSGSIGDTEPVPQQPDRAAQNALGWLENLENGLRIPLTQPTIKIGRHRSNLVILEDATVHRYHATLELGKRGQFQLRDLGGVNGTFVNGSRCQNKELADGDVVELGTVRMRFHVNRQARK